MRRVCIDEPSFVEAFTDTIKHLEYPVAGPGSVNQYIVAREIAKNFKVSLSGQGGDEIFFGYGRAIPLATKEIPEIEWLLPTEQFNYLIESYRKNLLMLPQALRVDKLGQVLALFIRMPSLNEDKLQKVLEDCRSLLSARVLNFSELSLLETYRLFELFIAMPALLHVEDRVSMAHGLETRLPLLDTRLVDFALAIKPDRILRCGLKGVVKELMANDLPVEVLNRVDKNGFNVPFVEWNLGETLTSKFCKLTEPETFLNSRATWGKICLDYWSNTSTGSAYD